MNFHLYLVGHSRVWEAAESSMINWCSRCFHDLILIVGTILRGDQGVAAGFTLPAKEAFWVDMPPMFPQVPLQMNSLVFELCSASRESWSCFILWNAWISDGWASYRSSACFLSFHLNLQRYRSHCVVKKNIEVYQLNRPPVSTTGFFSRVVVCCHKGTNGSR